MHVSLLMLIATGTHCIRPGLGSDDVTPPGTPPRSRGARIEARSPSAFPPVTCNTIIHSRHTGEDQNMCIKREFLAWAMISA